MMTLWPETPIATSRLFSLYWVMSWRMVWRRRLVFRKQRRWWHKTTMQTYHFTTTVSKDGVPVLPKLPLREGEPVWVLLLGYPAVMVSAGFGQNGFLSTALLGGAAVWLDRRPVLAGICLGSLAYKPQLGIIIPLALAAAGRWRCFAVAGATVLAMAAAATLAFGADIWPAFIAGMAEARLNWLEPINPPYLQFFITVYGAVRLHGGPLFGRRLQRLLCRLVQG